MEIKSDNLKIIIPAAGYGRRMGSPESKEMFLGSDGRPLIEKSLMMAKELGAKIHVITRIEKKSLISYLENMKGTLDLTTQVVGPTREWPHTLLLSQDYWIERNIILLPDTIWGPNKALHKMAEMLTVKDAVYATFEIKDDLSFGFVNISDSELRIVEKPKAELAHFQAWGILGFRKSFGENILNAHLDSTFDHQEKICHLKAAKIDLDFFIDQTR